MLERIKAGIRNNKDKILAGVSFLAAGYFIYKYFQEESLTKLSQFLQAVQQSKVEDVIIKGSNIYYSVGSDWYQTFIGRYSTHQIYSMIISKNISFEVKEELLSPTVISLLTTFAISIASVKYIKHITNSSIPTVQFGSTIYAGGPTFDDYYGGQNLKEKFREVIDFIQNSQKYESMGARIRRGVLLHGPPGTGKTLLARSLANEAGCSFIKVVASEFQEIFGGVGPKRVRQLFQNARKCPNGCIIFIDEIDALGSRLNHLRDSHETTKTINQFLSQMDGFYPNQKVVIVGATNRIDMVDNAIMRAGRFDLKVFIPLPSAQQRKGIFKKILGKKVGELNNIEEEFIDRFAKESQNWCGADIQTLINESIYKAIQEQKQFLSSEHVGAAFRELHHRK